MKKIHKMNMVIIIAAVLALAVTAYGKFGMSSKTYAAAITLGIGGLVAVVSYFLRINDILKALGILLLSSICAMVYSYVVGGSSAAYVALFLTLAMSTVYFNRKIILYFAIPIILILFTATFLAPQLIEGPEAPTVKGAMIKSVVYTLTAMALFLATRRGERTISRVKGNKDKSDEVAGQLVSYIDGCRAAMSEISNSAGDMNTSADEMRNSMENMSSTTMHVNKVVNDAVLVVDENINLTQELSEEFQEMNRATKQGSAVAGEVKSALTRMEASVSSANEAAVALLKDMEEIQNFLGRINVIAFKSKLLSLNASIEAVRAGAHGKGFSVVADEIRGLSDNSQKTSDDIKQIVEKLESQVELVSERIMKGEKDASVGLTKVDDLMSVLSEVSQSTDKVGSVIDRERTIIDSVKQGFSEIGSEVEVLVNVAELNQSMITNISEHTGGQSNSIERVSSDFTSISELADALSAM